MQATSITTYPAKSRYWFLSDKDYYTVCNDNYILYALKSTNINYIGIYSYRAEKDKDDIKDKNDEVFRYHTFLYVYFEGSNRISLNYLQHFKQIKLSKDLEHLIRLGKLPGLPQFKYYKFYHYFLNNVIETKEKSVLYKYFFGNEITNWNTCELEDMCLLLIILMD